MHNSVDLIGYVGKDPEFKKSQSGKETATLSLATSKTWNDKHTDEKKQITHWHRIVVFNPFMISILKNYVKKGVRIGVFGGELTYHKYKGRDGLEKISTDVIFDFGSKITLFDRQEKIEAQNSQPIITPQKKEFVAEDLDDGIPF